MRILAGMVALLTMPLLGTLAAEASSRVCRQLEAQLAAPGRANSPQARRHDRAIENQRSHLTRARRDAANLGCSGFSPFRQSSSQCGALNGAIDRMVANLARLEAQRASMGGGGDRRARGRILAALEANGCRDGGPVQARRPAAENLPGVAGGRQAPSQPARPERQRVVIGDSFPRSPALASGTFRTLCVRTCDGYFFPISFNSSAMDFARDEQACRAMCPGTETALYAHRFPGQESEDMVSVSGIPYTQLPTAFDYRRTGFQRPPGCECRRERNFTILAGEPRRDEAAEAEEEEAESPLPTWRPDPSTPLETQVNIDGGLTPDAMVRLLRSRPGEDAGEQERRIRVVGPAFLPDQEAELDLTSPGRQDVR